MTGHNKVLHFDKMVSFVIDSQEYRMVQKLVRQTLDDDLLPRYNNESHFFRAGTILLINKIIKESYENKKRIELKKRLRR